MPKRYRSRSRRYRRGKRGLRRRAKRFASRVRRVVLRTAETKYSEGVWGADVYWMQGANAGVSLGNNFGAVGFNPWAAISQGTGQGNRVGTEIIARGMKVRWTYVQSTATDYAPHFIRIIVVVLPKLISGSAVTSTNMPLFTSGTYVFASSIPVLNAMPDTDTVKVLYDKVKRVDQPNSVSVGTVGAPSANFYGTSFVSHGKFYLKTKRGNGKLAWEQDGTTLKNRPIAIYCLPYTYGALGASTKMGYFGASWRLYFKDP